MEGRKDIFATNETLDPVGKPTHKPKCYICHEPAKHTVSYCAEHYPEFVGAVNKSACIKQLEERKK